MLFKLYIENIALIEKLNIEFCEGLNILTGETGAGKSIIIDSINALLGGRTSRDIIKSGKEKALVEGLFFIENKHIASNISGIGIELNEDLSLALSREIFLNGRNVCRANGRIISLSQLKELGEVLINIHGQNDTHDLLDTSMHMDFLDRFSGQKLLDIKKKYKELFFEVNNLKNKIKELTSDDMERERRIDLLEFQINEIEMARLKEGEEEELSSEINILSNAEKIKRSVSICYEEIYSSGEIGNSAYDLISSSINELSHVIEFDSKLKKIYESLEGLNCQLEDISREICDYKDDIEYDPNILDELQQRMDVIFGLKRKYGNSIGEILKYWEEIKSELEEMSSSDEKIKLLQEEYNKKGKELSSLALELSQMRKEKAKLLENHIMNELKELDMKKTNFRISVKEVNNEERFNQNGMDEIEFIVSTNPGEPLKPLAKIASGGELSRIMLAIKNILAHVDHVETLIFDEIDIGISGIAAQRVAEKLSKVSNKKQVLCITHLAQIASFADNHLVVSKKAINKRTETEVNKLNQEDSIDEIARIIGGAIITENSQKHAHELIEMADKIKRKHK